MNEHGRLEDRLNLLQFAIEIIPDAVYWLTLDGRILNCNAAACRMLGYAREELLSLSVHHIDPEYSPEDGQADLEKLRRTGVLHLKRWNRTKDGRKIPVEVTSNFFLCDDAEYICCIARDVSELRRAQTELDEIVRELRFTQFTIDQALVQAFWMTEDGRFFYVNDAACRSLGYSREELLGMSVPDINPTCSPEEFPAYWKETREKGSLTFETIHRTKDGRVLPVEIRANYVVFDGKEYSCAFATDISERKRMEETLQKTHAELESRVRERTEQLTSLTTELSLAEERERRRIATELHDQVGQTLIMSKIGLAALSPGLPAGDFENSRGEIRKQITRALEDIRSLTFQLSPPLLYEVGLEAALEWLGEEFEAKHGFQVVFQDDGKRKPVDEETGVALFQMVRELLVNVAKHARAKKAAITVEKISGRIRISVADDGTGFDAMNGMRRKKRGFGHFNIRQRIEYMGGKFEVESTIGHGTRVALILPIASKGIPTMRKRP